MKTIFIFVTLLLIQCSQTKTLNASCEDVSLLHWVGNSHLQSGRYLFDMKNKICGCGKVFVPKNYGKRFSKFCSMGCSVLYKNKRRPKPESTITKTCPCGKAFEAKKWRLEQGKDKCCSRVCGYKYMIRSKTHGYTKHKENSGWFKKNNLPWNNGLGGTGICKPNKGSIKGGERRGVFTEFKSGQRSWNKDKKFPERSGEHHPLWKGDDVGYEAIHGWVYRQLGKASSCERCGALESKRFQWHNKSHLYKRDISDWESLCAKCHANEHKNWEKRAYV